MDDLVESLKILHNNYLLLSERSETLKSQNCQENFQLNHMAFLRYDYENYLKNFQNTLYNVQNFTCQLSSKVQQWHYSVRLDEFEVPEAKRKLEIIEKNYRWLWVNANLLTEHYKNMKHIWEKHPSLMNMETTLEENAKKIKRILSEIMKSSFLVVGQPQKIIKFGNKIVSVVQHLLGEFFNIAENSPTATMMAVSAHDADEFQSRGKIPRNPCGDIRANQTKLHLDKGSEKYLASFLNSRLMGLQRNTRRGEQSVTDEKFYFVFVVTLPIPGWPDELTTICCLSHPIVGIVHDSQRPSSLATIVWDNVLCQTKRHSSDTVPWCYLSEQMNKIFRKETNTNLPLSEENLNFLYNKLCTKTPPYIHEPNNLVSWRRFSKEPMLDLKFTFWKWFYSTMKLIREHLRADWNNNCIIGYISKADAHENLKRCTPGTFLLRFSDSIEEGAISVARLLNNNVEHLEPSNSDNLKSRCLNDRLMDLNSLKYLYPNIPKEMFFKERNEKPVKSGYKPTPLRVADTTVTELCETPNSGSPSSSMEMDDDLISSYLYGDFSNYDNNFALPFDYFQPTNQIIEMTPFSTCPNLSEISNNNTDDDTNHSLPSFNCLLGSHNLHNIHNKDNIE